MSLHSTNLRRALLGVTLGAVALSMPTHAQRASAAGGASVTPALAQRVAAVELDLRRTEAIRAVKRLQHAYAQYHEVGLWNDMADLFADGGVVRDGSGTYTGRENVRRHLIEDVGHGKVGISTGEFRGEIVMEPVVTFDPDFKTIRARWHALGMHGDEGKSGTWLGRLYENQYVEERGAWKIAVLDDHPIFTQNYEDPGSKENLEGQPYHYDSTRAGTPVPAGRAAAAATPALDSAALVARVADLDRRADRLEDEGAIINLQGSYGYYVDRKMWDDVADLFAGSGTLELDRRGVYVGAKSIRRALDQFGTELKPGELNDHLQLETIVDVSHDGRSARARGVELRMLGVNEVGGEWNWGTFENEYVKQDGVWKIKSAHVYPRLFTDYDKGWRFAKPAPGASAAFPPDRPSTGDYRPYPAVSYPAFHYTNPATGKVTQYPAGAAVAPVPSVARTPSAIATSGRDLDLGLEALERKIARARARDGAENVTSAYGYYIDDFLWTDTGALFAREGWKELSYIGTYVGRDRVTQSMTMRYGNRNGRTRGTGNFQMHQKTQPVIHVSDDGRYARIRARLWQWGGGAQGSWIGGLYENQAVLEDGVWKIAGMDLDYVWLGGYKTGWTKIAANDSRRYAPQTPPPVAPDRALRGPVFAPFPDTFDAAFHYPNPVSGRVPNVLLTDGQPMTYPKASPVQAARAWTPTRTVDGQPDLQGTWVNFDDTPFESTGPGRRPSDVNPPEHWTDHDSPTSKARRSMVVEPADGLVPLLKSAEEKRDYNLARIGDSWEYETPWVRCITRGVPGGFFPAQYNNAYQIIQTPGYVVIRSEMVHDTRIIPLDGRPKLGAAIRQWNGDSRGHWEGNTLVVETANYNDKGMIATSAASGRVRGVGQSDAMHLVERFTRTGEKTIEYEARIEDPKNYSKPWRVAFPFNLDNTYEIYEYSCHEGNYAMINELTAGRKHDAESKK